MMVRIVVVVLDGCLDAFEVYFLLGYEGVVEDGGWTGVGGLEGGDLLLVKCANMMLKMKREKLEYVMSYITTWQAPSEIILLSL